MHPLFYCDTFDIPLPAGHKFPLTKYKLVRQNLAATNRFDFVLAPLASPADLERAHEPAYVRSFLDGSLDRQIIRRIGFPWSEGLVQRTLASVGGTLGATQTALQQGWSGTLAGGTHHAMRSEGAGFCVFNDLAVAIEWLRAHGHARRPAVIDLDVHQGDGTAQIYQDDPDVFTLSVHGEANFPFRKQQSRLDVALPDGTEDARYLEALDAALPQVEDFAPDFLFYQSGVDGLATDRLGRLSLTLDGLKERDRRVFHFVQKMRVPFVITLGGGYSHPIENTAAAHTQTFLLAFEMLNVPA